MFQSQTNFPQPPGYLKWRGGVRKWRGWREWSEWSENGVCKDPPLLVRQPQLKKKTAPTPTHATHQKTISSYTTSNKKPSIANYAQSQMNQCSWLGIVAEGLRHTYQGSKERHGRRRVSQLFLNFPLHLIKTAAICTCAAFPFLAPKGSRNKL